MKMTETLPNILCKSKQQLQPAVRMFGDSKALQVLISVFVLQLLIAGGLFWKSNLQAQFAPATQLVTIDPSTVDEVIINDGNDTVSLTRLDAQWQMNDELNTSASVDKVDKLISDIAELKPGLAVTSTRGAHRQLEVADDNFQRQVTLKAGVEIVADLYLGTSPGFRKSHVRQVDYDEVYSGRLNTFDVPADYDNWLNKNLLSFDNVKGIQSEEINLAYADDQWSIVNPEDQRETHQVDKLGIDSLVSQLTTLRVNGFSNPLEVDEPVDEQVANAEAEPSEPSEPKELITHTITVMQNDSPITLVLSKLGSDVTIERSDIPGLFSLPLATYDALKSDIIKNLVVPKVSDASDEDDLPQG